MENFSSAFSDNYWGGSPISCTGLYKLDKEENIEQLYKFFGVPWFMRKILGFIKPKPTLQIEQNGDDWLIVYSWKSHSSRIPFTLGQAFEMNPGGPKSVRGVARFDNNRLTLTARDQATIKGFTNTLHFTQYGATEVIRNLDFN